MNTGKIRCWLVLHSISKSAVGHWQLCRHCNSMRNMKIHWPNSMGGMALKYNVTLLDSQMLQQDGQHDNHQTLFQRIVCLYCLYISYTTLPPKIIEVKNTRKKSFLRYPFSTEQNHLKLPSLSRSLAIRAWHLQFSMATDSWERVLRHGCCSC